MKFLKYQGAGNDFLIADNRDGRMTEKDGVLTAVLEDGSVWTRAIADICDRRYGVGADGLMLLDAAPEGMDFVMTYFNSDGSGGMMCGNGGRCIVAFAHDCGIPGLSPAQMPDSQRRDWLVRYSFTAADGPHEAYVYESTKGTKTIGLRMKDVDEFMKYEGLTGVDCPADGYFLDTGTRHYVRFIERINDYDIIAEGRQIRYNAQELQPVGVNVNFVEPCDDHIKVRTYEKGVEDETFACGTGIVASALAAYLKGIAPSTVSGMGRKLYDIRARRDRLTVDFIPSKTGVAEDIFLTGPACFVAEIHV